MNEYEVVFRDNGTTTKPVIKADYYDFEHFFVNFYVRETEVVYHRVASFSAYDVYSVIKK